MQVRYAHVPVYTGRPWMFEHWISLVGPLILSSRRAHWMPCWLGSRIPGLYLLKVSTQWTRCWVRWAGYWLLEANLSRWLLQVLSLGSDTAQSCYDWSLRHTTYSSDFHFLFYIILKDRDLSCPSWPWGPRSSHTQALLPHPASSYKQTMRTSSVPFTCETGSVISKPCLCALEFPIWSWGLVAGYSNPEVLCIKTVLVGSSPCEPKNKNKIKEVCATTPGRHVCFDNRIWWVCLSSLTWYEVG